MTSVPPEAIVLEILTDAPVDATTVDSTQTVEVSVGTIFTTGEPQQPEVVEVPEYPPLGGGYYHAEVLPFTAQGNLAVTMEPAQFPIPSGSYRIKSIAGRVVTAPTGSSVVVDIRKNGVSIFSNPALRPTISPGQNSAVVGDYGMVMLAGGDYIEVMITAVGSTTPGKTLVVSVRLERVG